VSRSGVLLVDRRRFWRLICEGWSTEVAAAAVGVSREAGRRWFAEAGGMSPVGLCEASRRYLGPDERELIGLRLAAGVSQAEIARELGRHRSTVSREVRRNRAIGWYPRPGYRPRLAQWKAEQRARRPKLSKLAADPLLRDQVQVRLEQYLSPRQISSQLRRDFPDDERMRVSHETIYRSLFVQGRGELRRELTRCLRTGRALRRPRARTKTGANLRDIVLISERPAEAADRAVPGHWEGDLVLGKNGRSAIGTLVERHTRFVMLLHLPGDHSAETVKDALVAKMLTLPAQLRRSLTWDQGSEMAKHAEISFAADLPIYFCDPASPWQRGSNENTNGLLTCPRFPGHLIWRDHRAWRGVLDACCEAAGVPASCGRVGAAA
jgi:IS30 family transposase